LKRILLQGKRGKKTVPSFVTPAAARDQVDFVKGNLDQNLVGTFFCQFFGHNCGLWTDASIFLV
jgi:hypothetical protein